ncbi:uncharacterized protein TNCV_627851 [Trichonephila clavipes]|nr:uncharacterized protein TNCV_627851 [Trichonephila clavipes]
MEDLAKKLLSGGKEKNKSVPVSAFQEPVLVSPVPVTDFTGLVKLSTYDGKTNWEVYKIQFSVISEASGWTEVAKAYNALDLRFGQKYSKDYARLQMKTRFLKPGESLQECASEVERLANLAFSDHLATMREVILQYFVDGLKDGEIQKAKNGKCRRS